MNSIEAKRQSAKEKKWIDMLSYNADKIKEIFEDEINTLITTFKKNLDSFDQYDIASKEAMIESFIKTFRAVTKLNCHVSNNIYVSIYFNFVNTMKPESKDYKKLNSMLSIKGILKYGFNDYDPQLSISNVTQISPYVYGLYNFIHENLSLINNEFINEGIMTNPFFSMMASKDKFKKQFAISSKAPMINIIDGLGNPAYPGFNIASLNLLITFETDRKRVVLSMPSKKYCELYKELRATISLNKAAGNNNCLKTLCLWIEDKICLASVNEISCRPHHIVTSRTDITDYKLTQTYKNKLQIHPNFDDIKSRLQEGNRNFFVASIKHEIEMEIKFDMSELKVSDLFKDFETNVQVTEHIETTSEKREKIDNLLLSFLETNSELIAGKWFTKTIINYETPSTSSAVEKPFEVVQEEEKEDNDEESDKEVLDD